MFSTTFLGHQGWAFGYGASCLLVDPLLTEPFGHGGLVGVVWPPRILAPLALPPISAVLLTHEHEDHFNIPSLNLLDRSIPILLSSRSSVAARKILKEMGFSVRLVDGGDHIPLGDLELYVLSVNHLTVDVGDEFDALPFVVRDVVGDGSFFSHVDVPLTESMEDSAMKIVGQPGLWCYTNSWVDYGWAQGGVASQRPPSMQMFHELGLERVRSLRRRYGNPAATMFCGAGFSFVGETRRFNRSAFPIDLEAACVTLTAAEPEVRAMAPVPGETVRMRAGQIVELCPQTRFLRTRPRDDWPEREYAEQAALLDEYEPASGRRQLSPTEESELSREMDVYAEHLFARRLFKALYSLSRSDLRGRQPTFAFVLLGASGGQPLLLEYRAQSCRFVSAEWRDPVSDYVCGFECWAGDLLGALRGGLGAGALFFGRSRSWSYARGVAPLDDLWLYLSPLRRPDAALALYRRLLSELETNGSKVQPSPRPKPQIVAAP